MKKIFTIDIGGTKVKYGVITERGEILEKGIMDTRGELGVDNLLGRLFIFIESYEEKFSGISISCSGQIDSKIGKIIGGTPIINNWVGTELKQIFQKKYNIPCEIENDVNCAALGELWQGAAKNEKDFLCITIGTGIGGGIIINKEIYAGNIGIAGELGHFQLIKNGKICTCGKKGCYEQYSSTNALIEQVEMCTGHRFTGKEIFKLAQEGNQIYIDIINNWIDYITDGLSILIQIFNPKLLIIGGGVSEQKDYLLEKISSSLNFKVHPNYLNNFIIKTAQCGNDAGLIGAAYNLIKKLKKGESNEF